jgi:hypothetical protein
MALETIEIDGVLAELLDAMVASRLADIIIEHRGAKYTNEEDRKYYEDELVPAVDTVLKYFTTEQHYKELLDI